MLSGRGRVGNKIAQWVKGSLYKLDEQSSMPGTHKGGRRESSPQSCHLISRMLWYHSPQYHIHTHIKIIIKKVIQMVGKSQGLRVLNIVFNDCNLALGKQKHVDLEFQVILGYIKKKKKNPRQISSFQERTCLHLVCVLPSWSA